MKKFKCKNIHYFPHKKEIECYSDDGILILTNISQKMALQFSEELIFSVRIFSDIRDREVDGKNVQI